jgi:Pin2-interacting protein X1
MLEKMGWSEGKGLGKNKDGITEHVKAVKKFDSRGIGADAKTSQQLYTAKTVAFSDILSKLAAEYGAAKPETEDKPAKKSSKLSTVSSSDDSSSDEETEKKKTNRVQ